MIRIRFNTMNEALLASVNRSFGISLIWCLLRELDGDNVDTVTEGFPLEFNEGMNDFTLLHDIPTNDLSDLMIATFRGGLV